MKKLFTQMMLAFLIAATLAPAEDPPAADPVYGDYPQNYKEIVNKWLETNLVDAPSAIVEWVDEPKTAELPRKNGETLRGFLVHFTVNSRNRFGAYTGKQKHGLLIRDGKVIKAIGF